MWLITPHGDRYGASGTWKTRYLINLICFSRANICNYIHLLLVILPTRCEFGMMEHRHLLHKHISQICEAQLDLILFYSHSMNQPKYICCLRGKGFKTNMKMGLNQITLLLTTRKFSSGHPSPLRTHIKIWPERVSGIRNEMSVWWMKGINLHRPVSQVSWKFLSTEFPVDRMEKRKRSRLSVNHTHCVLSFGVNRKNSRFPLYHFTE